MVVGASAQAQVKHNFEMGPESTDCHQIVVEDKTAEELIQEIQQRTFRFRQKINISRYRSPRSLEYASCDGESGFLLAETGDNKFELYTEISKSAWETILNSTDVLEYFSREFKPDHKPFRPE